MGGGVSRLGFGVLLAVTLDGRTGLIPGRAWTAPAPHQTWQRENYVPASDPGA